jgi:ATP-binding cassette subfamily F protein 3
MQKPNLLLLDEPTNHLDLDMRQALSMALVEYSGALLVISHDRHLLRSVCDSLYVVHDGQLQEFDQSIDDYPNWLKSQETEEETGSAPGAAPASTNKKQSRQQEAAKRKALQPFSDKVKKIEKAMNKNKTALEEVETCLHDETLYTDASRKQEMTGLLQKKAELKSTLEDLEWQWLEASEALELAENEL